MPETKSTITLNVDEVLYETATTRKFEMRKPFCPPDPNKVASFLPGVVQAIQIAAGQPVRRGDTLLTLEAMKMENSFTAPRDGVIKAVHVAQGEMVPKGRVLVEFED
jgi:biotin carboxyl carrier protein